MRRALLGLLLLATPIASAAWTYEFEYVGGGHADNVAFYVEGVCDEFQWFRPVYLGGVCSVPVSGRVEVDTYEDSILITGFHWAFRDAAGRECEHGWALWDVTLDTPAACGRLDVLMSAGSAHGFITVAHHGGPGG